MAPPKKKQSRGRRDRRRYNGSNALAETTLSVCSNCNESKRPHTVCSACGYYENRPVLELKVRTKQA